MKPKTAPTKAHRVLDFLHALEHPEIAELLTLRGFTPAVREEGWTLLRRHAAARYWPVPVAPVNDGILRQLEAWRSRWLPVMRASIRARYPSIDEQLFVNLSRTSGNALLRTLPPLLVRLRNLERQPKKSDAARARELLRRRGLTESVLADAEALIERLMTLGPVVERRPVEELKAAAKDAEDALWRWYREWSDIARASVQDARLLRVLGFGRAGRPKGAKNRTAKERARKAAPDGTTRRRLVAAN